MSTTKAEYIVLGHAAREAVWICCFINKMSLEIAPKIIIHEDNKMSIALTKNAKSQHYTKHIDVQHYYIRELIEEKNSALSRLVVSRC